MDSKQAAMASVAPGHWRRVENPDRSRRIDLTFPGAANRVVLRAQVDSWLDALERCVDRDAVLGEHAALLIPSRGNSDSAEAPILHFPAPMRVGAGILAGKRDPADVLDVLRRIATALDVLHARAFIHGAVGMSSLWWMRDGTLRFADAGLTHLLDGVVSPPKVAGAYLAPEVWRRAGIVPASDQYGLAVIAFELFTGRVRYVEDAANGVQSVQPLTLEAGERLYEHAPAELNEVMQRALSASPSARYGSCTEFVEALAGHATAAKSLPTVHRFAGFGVGSRRKTLALLAVTVVALGASAYVMRTGLTQRSIAVNFDLDDVAYAAREKAGDLPTIDVSSRPARSPSAGTAGTSAGVSNRTARGSSDWSGGPKASSGGSAQAESAPSFSGAKATTPASAALRTRAEVLARDLKRAVVGNAPIATPAYSPRSGSGSRSSSSISDPSITSRGPSGGGGGSSGGGAAPSRGGGSSGGGGGAATSGGTNRGGTTTRATGSTGGSRTGDSAATSRGGALANTTAPATGTTARATLSDRVTRIFTGAPQTPAAPLARGTLELKGPVGARFYIDGVLVRPVRGKVATDEGEHDVDIVIPNGSIYRHRVTVRGGQTVVIRP